MDAELRDLYADLRALFRRERVRWFVFGGQAAVLHGAPRLTLDVDVTATLDASRLPAFVAAAAAAGFDARWSDAEFIARTRVLALVHRATGLPVDVVLAGSGFERSAMARAVEVDVGGVRVPVVSPEDFLTMKVLAGRPKDLDDVRGVLLRAPSLDLRAVRRRLRALERALDRDDLVGALDAVVRSSRRRR